MGSVKLQRMNPIHLGTYSNGVFSPGCVPPDYNVAGKADWFRPSTCFKADVARNCDFSGEQKTVVIEAKKSSFFI